MKEVRAEIAGGLDIGVVNGGADRIQASLPTLEVTYADALPYQEERFLNTMRAATQELRSLSYSLPISAVSSSAPI
jgi:hypothetical protein